MRKYARGVAVALALGVVTGNSEAAPVSMASSALKSATVKMSDVVAVASSRCWWRNGKQRCRTAVRSAASRSHGSVVGGSDYYEQIADKARVGSQRWWDLKEREGSTGRP